MSRTLKLAYGSAETIALKFDSGKEVEGRFGPQVAFSVVDRDGQDQVLYLDKEPAAGVELDLRRLGIRTREYFRIARIRQGNATRFEIEPIERAPIEHPAAAPAEANAIRIDTAPVVPLPSDRAPVTSLSARVCATMRVLIDSMIEAKAYADRRSLALTNDDLRCLVTTAYIQESRR